VHKTPIDELAKVHYETRGRTRVQHDCVAGISDTCQEYKVGMSAEKLGAWVRTTTSHQQTGMGKSQRRKISITSTRQQQHQASGTRKRDPWPRKNRPSILHRSSPCRDASRCALWISKNGPWDRLAENVFFLLCLVWR